MRVLIEVVLPNTSFESLTKKDRREITFELCDAVELRGSFFDEGPQANVLVVDGFDEDDEEVELETVSVNWPSNNGYLTTELVSCKNIA